MSKHKFCLFTYFIGEKNILKDGQKEYPENLCLHPSGIPHSPHDALDKAGRGAPQPPQS